MLEELRIKCPSCGIILDVRNSRREAVKRIVCPNCKKQLALDFREQPQEAVPQQPPTPLYHGQQPLTPLYHGQRMLELREGINQIPLSGCEFVEIRVARLTDGSTKCIVSPLTADHPVKVNGTALLPDDKVALAIGDELQTGSTLLVYGKPGVAEAPAAVRAEEKKPDRPRKSHSYAGWFYGAMACIAVALTVVALWPAAKDVPANEGNGSGNIEIKEDVPVGRKNDPQSPKSVEEGKPPKEKKKTADPKSLSDYELEQQALGGDVEAQFQLGNKLVRRSGSNSIIRGINYLRQASLNGSAKADKVLNNAIYSLQRKASNGDSIANYILMSIN